jgi:hypothetical protein
MSATSAGDLSRPPSLLRALWAHNETTNRAQLLHLRQDVDNTPGLCDSTVDEAEDKDLVIGDGFAGWWDAHVLAEVRPSNQVPADNLVPFRDHIVDRDMKVGERAKERREHVLYCLRSSHVNRHWRADQRVQLDELVDRPEMISASFEFMASEKRLDVALFCSVSAVGMPGLLFNKMQYAPL